jgi:predicted ribosome quality control (RQC) complex YloA/Tae2 family protein
MASGRSVAKRSGRPFRRLIEGGFEILIGRGAEENDELTFHVAAPSDRWLHVAGGTPGSHVVVRNPDRANIPKAVIERAASHAAWYSKARGRGAVEVHHCKVSDIRKPKGAPPGLVHLLRHERVRVRPEPPRPEEDADDGESSDEQTPRATLTSGALRAESRSHKARGERPR